MFFSKYLFTPTKSHAFHHKNSNNLKKFLDPLEVAQAALTYIRPEHNFWTLDRAAARNAPKNELME